MLRSRLVPTLPCLVLMTACGGSDPDDPSASEMDGTTATETDSADSGEGSSGAAEDSPLTYWRDTKAIIDAKCGSCHRPDDIAPFSLQTHAEVAAVAAILPASIETETMPPWPPSASCRGYSHSRALDEDDRETLLAWLEDGAPEGDPEDAPPPVDDGPSAWQSDLSLEISEPYTPTMEPDDYRCFLVPWPEAETTYITGYQVVPGNREVVHHVIMFNVDAETAPELQAMDDAEPGPGYTCFGGVGARASWIGSWVPGTEAGALPEGTGMEIEPGSMMVIQMHYNTLSSEPAADQTRVDVQTSATVQRAAAALPLLNPGWLTGSDPMLIPANEAEVTYSHDISASSPLVRLQLAQLGLEADDPFVIHAAGLHMHYLGTAGSLSVVRQSGAEDCVVDIPAWDFNWQGGYTLEQSLRVEADDTLRLSCTWDNSEGNQPVIGGEILPSKDVEWGEGTTDEMCLGVAYVSAPL